MHVLPVFANDFRYGMAVPACIYPNVQYVPHYSVIHGERQPPRTALHACIEELCLHW